MIIRRAAEDDVWQIADILVEDWKTAYRGIIDSEYLDSMSVEERYRRELSRYRIYRVAAAEKEILGLMKIRTAKSLPYMFAMAKEKAESEGRCSVIPWIYSGLRAGKT